MSRVEVIKRVALVAGPLLGVLLPLVLKIPEHPQASAMLGIAVWMALWWLTECVPLAVTALLPLLGLPLAGIASAQETAPRYMTSVMFLFVGGFLIAQAMESTGLHKRIALVILSHMHASPWRIMLGFALTTAFLSMWISNTATTMLMVTIAVAVLARLDAQLEATDVAMLAAPLLLTIAYAANIGGMGTPVGTVPNLVFLENIQAHAPELRPTFMQWMLVGVPLVVLGLLVVLFFLGRKVRGMAWSGALAEESLHNELRGLGAMRREERWVAWVLGITALAWMTREGIQGDDFSLPGWSALLPYKGIDDGTVAMAAALALFLVPAQEGRPVLGHGAFTRLPWEILILLGGGFALAMGMQQSGLSKWMGDGLAVLAAVPWPLMLLGIAFAITFLTEITSNTATTQVMLPILAAVALGMEQDMTALLLVATLAASCAFMLPVATPPNAIIFGTNRITMRDMMRAGIRLNLTMPLVIVAMVILIRPLWP